MHSEENLPEIPEGLEPLTPNAGGPGDPSDLVGREEELARLIQSVTVAKGAHVVGARRMGKTWLVKKLQEELSGSATAIYVSAETGDLDGFADRLYSALRDNDLVRERVSRWEKEIGGELKLTLFGKGLTLVAKGKKPAADETAPNGLNVLDLLESTPSGPVVLIIDEITVLCDALGKEDAIEFLRDLRSRRESGGSPLVLCGSIGLHHVLDNMTPVTGLWTVDVKPLKPRDAVVLAARLLMGIGVEPTPGLVRDIIRETSAIPYYIQGVVDKLQFRDDLDVEATVADCITTDAWNTSHYRKRLPDYYGERAVHVEAILDIVAVSKSPLDFDVIKEKVSATDQDLTMTRDDLLDLLDRLEKDHYLTRVGNADEMSSPLLARIWRHLKRLE